MTGTLRDVMREQADAQASPVFDVEAIAAAGNRRLRRTRVATGSLVVAAFALAAVGLPQLVDGAGTTDADGLVAEAAEPFADRKVGFAAGDVIQWGEETFSVGATIAAYVQTDDGFVYTTQNGDVWLYDGRGSERIGHAANNRLRADDTGSLVAWVDLADDGAPQYVVFDTGSRKEAARVDDGAAGPSREPEDEGAEVFAVDDVAAYWRTEDGIVRYDVATGESELVHRPRPIVDPADKPAQVTDIVDVAAGWIAYVEDDEGGRMRVGTAIGKDAEQMPSGWNGVLSPDGRYIGVEEADEMAVYDTATTEAVTPAIDGYVFKVVYGWVDEDTAMVFGIKNLEGETYPTDFLACDIPDGACEVTSATELGATAFALPVGDPMDT